MQKKIWTHYLTRPFNLFIASLWFGWYSQDESVKLFGCNMPDALFIEDQINVTRHYRRPEQLAKFHDAARNLVIERPEQCIAALMRGVSLSSRAGKIIESGINPFNTVGEALDFTNSLALNSTTLPIFACQYSQNNSHDTIFRISEELRANSKAQEFINKILLPFALSCAQVKYQSSSDRLLEVIMASELTENREIDLTKRLKDREDGLKFILEYDGNMESLLWSQDTLATIDKIEGDLDKNSREILGQVAYKGRAKGIVRVVFDPDKKDLKFNNGDILVTINSNPAFIHLAKKSCAIITDEGGISCHAAIIARELKIPCIIGTKIATKVLKDGDIVEVDADNGIVRKINE